ncbi:MULTISPECIES: hypothetical protein [unclassified Paludibacterium]|uniref:hypothetical protein n=1 Tax=unclassified Paludibacterium TaxID=2618429 RepID=UPI001C05A026|nr:hypothetical protein [Paludibacterium sp. B53371]BEV73459.1 hypothetical protein THUN1379_29410 [Paludibacterium sp. THUN1379]
MEFNEVKPEHFSTLSRDPHPHILIDRYLMQLVGGGTAAPPFHKKIMAAAGWKHHSLTPFTKYPAEASVAYNKVREALRSCDQDPDALLQALGGDPDLR